VAGTEAPVEVDAPVHGGRRWDPLHRRRRRLRMGMHESAFCDLVTRRRWDPLHRRRRRLRMGMHESHTGLFRAEVGLVGLLCVAAGLFTGLSRFCWTALLV